MNCSIKGLVTVCLLSCLTGCVSNGPAPVSDVRKDYSSITRGEYRGSYYEVKKGDTLYFIAYLTDKNVNDLIALNKLSPPYTIYPGQRINLWHSTYQPPSYGKSAVNTVNKTGGAPVSDVAIGKQTSTYASQTTSSRTEGNVVVHPIGISPPLARENTVNGVSTSSPVRTSSTPVSSITSVRPMSSSTTVIPAKPAVSASSTATEKPVYKVISVGSNTNSAAKSEASTVVMKPSVTKNSINSSQNEQYTEVSKNNSAKVNKVATDTVEPSNSKAYVEPISKETVKSELKTTDSTKVDEWLWPTKGRVVNKFSSGDQGNKGIDIAGQRGQAIVATAAGSVVYSGNALRGYGNLIIIKHNDNYLSAYAHNDQLLVKEGQNVVAGQKIATMGSTGSSSVRLHFEIRYQGKSVNPSRYLP